MISSNISINSGKTIIEHLVDRLAPRLKERRDEFERLANTDELTGLANRRAFELAEKTAVADKMTFVLFDLNNFGLVNKRVGHAAGDELLKYYADVLANAAFKFKVRAFRLGGDEFAAIAPRRFAEKIRDAVERRALVRDFGNFNVSISGTVGATIQQADEILQARKAARKAQ